MTQPMTNESLSKYELWGQTLQGNIEAMHRQKRMFRIMFFGAAILSAIGFFFGVWIGVGTFFTGIMVCGAGLYITYNGIERLVVDALEGNDRFYVSGSSERVVLEILGGLGSDVFNIGGFNGQPVTVVGNGLLARCLQHETDHLNGTVFGDRLPARARKKLYAEHHEVAGNYPDDWPVHPRTGEDPEDDAQME